MNKFIKEYSGVNRIYKPMSLLAYTDYKNGKVKSWNPLTESKDIDLDKLLLDVDGIEQETMSAIGTDEGVKNHYANGYKHGIDLVKTIIEEDRQFKEDLIEDLKKKQTEIYSDVDSLSDEEADEMGIDGDYVEGYYQAFEDVLSSLGEPDKLNETTDKELAKMKAQLPSRIDVPYEEWTDEQKELDRKIACIEMIHSILTYDDIKSADDVMQNKYMQRYIEELGETKVKELVEQEIEEFKSATINKDVYTDSEGVTYNSVTFKDESKTLTEAPTKNSAEYKKLCTEIEFQADENDFNLTEEDVKAVADRMIANKFFFNYNIMDDEDNENVQDWETINSIIVNTIKDYLEETKGLEEDKSEECDLEDCMKCIKELQEDIQNHKLGYHNKQYTKVQVRENKKINSVKIKELEAKMANLKK